MLGKFEFYRFFFHGLMISEKNINKNNIKWLTRSCSLMGRTSIFTKKTCVLTEICCVLLVIILPDIVWCWCYIIKQIFHTFFCFKKDRLSYSYMSGVFTWNSNEFPAQWWKGPFLKNLGDLCDVSSTSYFIALIWNI